MKSPPKNKRKGVIERLQADVYARSLRSAFFEEWKTVKKH